MDNFLQKKSDAILVNQLRKVFNEEGILTKNVTFSLSEDIIQKIEEITESNKKLEKESNITGLPVTKSDLIANAIEVYSESYFKGLAMLTKNLEDLPSDIESGESIQSISPTIADTIIVAARIDGFNQVFLNDNEWHKVRVATWRLPYLKYLGVYVTSPISKVTHYAPIKSFELLPDKKYKFKLGEPIELNNPIVLSEIDLIGLKQTVYTTLDHLKKSKYLYQLSNWWHQDEQ